MIYPKEKPKLEYRGDKYSSFHSYYLVDDFIFYTHNEYESAMVNLYSSKCSRWHLFGYEYRSISGLLRLLSLTSGMVKILAPGWKAKSLKANILMAHIIKNNNFSKLNKAQKAKIYKLGDNYLTRKLYGKNKEWKEYMMISEIIK